jgi:hypothetical protein
MVKRYTQRETPTSGGEANMESEKRKGADRTGGGKEIQRLSVSELLMFSRCIESDDVGALLTNLLMTLPAAVRLFSSAADLRKPQPLDPARQLLRAADNLFCLKLETFRSHLESNLTLGVLQMVPMEQEYMMYDAPMEYEMPYEMPMYDQNAMVYPAVQQPYYHGYDQNFQVMYAHRYIRAQHMDMQMYHTRALAQELRAPDAFSSADERPRRDGLGALPICRSALLAVPLAAVSLDSRPALESERGPTRPSLLC